MPEASKKCTFARPAFFPLGKRPLNVRSIPHPAAQGLTTGISGSWCTFKREEETPQKSAEHGTLRCLRKEVFYDEDTFRLPRQYTTLLHQTRMNTEFVGDGASVLDHI